MNAIATALKRLEEAEEQFMRDCGWLPANPDDPLNRGDDWTPPEHRSNYWDRNRALAECRRRVESIVYPYD